MGWYVLSVTFSGNRRGICPAGWHVPSNAEWTQLTNYVYNNGYQCPGCSGTINAARADCIAKALASQTGWNSSGSTYAVGNDPSTNNATGFSAVPAGYYTGSGSSGYYAGGYTFGTNTYYWSSASKFKELVEDGGLSFVTEHVLGVAKDSDEEMIKDLNAHFMGEATEVGMYLAMSRQADREGYPEVVLLFL